jgi:hypothetical protein
VRGRRFLVGLLVASSLGCGEAIWLAWGGVPRGSDIVF